jgi:phospholipase/lecithinase/hemolysin
MTGKFRASIGMVAVVAAWLQIGSVFAGYSGLVAFGDSLTDQGNTISYLPPEIWMDETGYDLNYYNAAYNSYGIAAEGRWSSGPTWIEYLNGRLLSIGASTNPVPLGENYGRNLVETDYGPGTNFAFGGSTTGSGHKNFVISNLQQQIADFLYLTQDSQSALYNYDMGGALFSVWSGGNDAIDWVEGERSAPIEDASTTAALNIQTAIVTLYEAGARNFLMLNLPDLGQKPNYRGTQNGIDATAFVHSYNDKLADVVLTLESTYADISITFFDAYATFNLLLEDPGAYGFTNIHESAYVFLGSTHDPTSEIVENPEEYIFWDSTHPTTQVHELLGRFAYEALPIPEPAVVVLLALGLGVFVSARRRNSFRSV